MTTRKTVLNSLITELKKIDGGVSTFDGSYTYATNLNGNASRPLRYWDEVNDFPAICLGTEGQTPIYQGGGSIQWELSSRLQLFAQGENAVEDLEDLIQDVLHVLENCRIDCVIDITVLGIDSDDGLQVKETNNSIAEIDILILFDGS